MRGASAAPAAVALVLAACAAEQPTAAEEIVSEPSATAAAESWDSLEPQPMPSAPLDQTARLDRIAFGSCLHQEQDHSIFGVISEFDPDLFLFIGDNVYGDVRSGSEDLPELKTAYAKLARSEPFAQFRAATPLLTTWDDHDYGLNDKGAEFEFKQLAEELFLDVWAVSENDERRRREGIYTSKMFGPEGRRIQIILLDTRYFRWPPLVWLPEDQREWGRYERNEGDDADMLGPAQWAWLEDELLKPAELRIIVSSVQVIADGHSWEAWLSFPRERQRLYDLIGETQANGVILISGDRHAGGFYRKTDDVPYPMVEMTSSSLNLPLSGWVEDIKPEPGPYRDGDMYYDENFGVIDVDWDAQAVALELRDKEGRLIRGQMVRLSELQVADGGAQSAN